MRVLHVMASGQLGGGATHLVGLLPALMRLGCACSAAVGDGPLVAKLLHAGVAVHRIDLMRTRFDLAAPRRLARVITSEAPDLVHYHGTRVAFLGGLARLWARLPLAVYTVHGLAYGREQGPVSILTSLAAEAVACLGAARVIAVSRRELASLVRRRLVRTSAIMHVPNAIDPAPFVAGERTSARARHDLASDAFVIGAVARLVPQKGMADLLDALAHLGGATLVVVGDGPLAVSLKERAQRLGARVRWLGERDDVAAIMPAFDVLVLSSRWEAEGIVLLEAMAAGVPCVATATHGGLELLGETGAGLVAPIKRPRELARAIERVRDDPALVGRLVAAGRAVVAGRSFAGMAASTLAVYRDLAQGL